MPPAVPVRMGAQAQSRIAPAIPARILLDRYGCPSRFKGQDCANQDRKKPVGGPNSKDRFPAERLVQQLGHEGLKGIHSGGSIVAQRTAGIAKIVKGYQMPARHLVVRHVHGQASDKPRGRKPRAGMGTTVRRAGAMAI